MNVMAVNGSKSLAHLRAIIFDYGEVLCFAPSAEEFAVSARILGVPTESFRTLWGRNRDLYDRGDFSAEAYWRKLADDAGKPVDARQLRELAERDVRMWSRINQQMIAWIGELSAAGIKTAILSNMHAEMARHARQNFTWFSQLSHQTLSAEVGLIKPDPAIYEHCLRGLSVAPHEALFLDDREVNVKGAQAVGIHALQFKSMPQLQEDLKAAGFPVLPASA